MTEVNNYPPIIAFTGGRNVGKTTAAEKLVNDYGYVRVHAFEGGKYAAYHYFVWVLTGQVDAPHEVASRMVYGDLKDKDSPYLPEGKSPRFFMEEFGHFMGVSLGVPWTLGMEIDRAKRIHGDDVKLVIESLVYEVDEIYRHNGVVWRLERPGFDSPVGVKTDATQRLIKEDSLIASSSLEELALNIDDLMAINAYAAGSALVKQE
jgi:hypothetical protein